MPLVDVKSLGRRSILKDQAQYRVLKSVSLYRAEIGSSVNGGSILGGSGGVESEGRALPKFDVS